MSCVSPQRRVLTYPREVSKLKTKNLFQPQLKNMLHLKLVREKVPLLPPPLYAVTSDNFVVCLCYSQTVLDGSNFFLHWCLR